MDTLVKETNAVPVDLLGRQEIVDRIMKILEVISEKKSSCTFALNGAWGTGKTFVLNMLMNQLWEYHSDKYIVFHYNCWQYDYYEEPLIAIVAAMLDSVDEESHLLPAHLRDKAKAGMELAKPVLQKIATDFVKNKIGVDLTEVVSSAKSYQDALDSEEKKKEEGRLFDEFYSFKKAIYLAQEEIRKLSKDRTLVVVVDELDRCLPSYSIKVLERLHHLFAEINNSAVLFAVDKKQLDKTVSQIYGNNTDTTKYLRKFINFELELQIGELNNHFSNKYHEYFELFNQTLNFFDFPYGEYYTALFSGINPRTIDRIMDRIKTVHIILFNEKKPDLSVMCFELLWVSASRFCSMSSNPFSFESRRSAGGVSSGFFFDPHVVPKPTETIPIDKMLSKYWGSPYITSYKKHSLEKSAICITGTGVMQKILMYYFERIFSSSSDTPHWYDLNILDFDTIESNIEALHEFISLIKVIQ